MGFLQSAEAEPPRSAVIVSMSPPGYPSAMVASPEPASVSPGKVIVSPASEPQTLLPPLAEREGTRETSPRASDLCGRVVDLVLIRKSCCAPEGIAILLQGRASGSNHLPWAFPRILQAIPKIKRAVDGNGRRADPGPGDACSKDVSGAFVRATRVSAIAAGNAGGRRGYGRSGRPRRDTGTRRQGSGNGTGKAGATGSASGTENHQQAKQLERPRG